MKFATPLSTEELHFHLGWLSAKSWEVRSIQNWKVKALSYTLDSMINKEYKQSDNDGPTEGFIVMLIGTMWLRSLWDAKRH